MDPNGHSLNARCVEVLGCFFPAGGLSELVSNKDAVRILFDRSHSQAQSSSWSTLVADLELRGADVIENFAPVTLSELSLYDVFWSVSTARNWTEREG